MKTMQIEEVKGGYVINRGTSKGIYMSDKSVVTDGKDLIGEIVSYFFPEIKEEEIPS